jgi:allantoinase
MPADLIVRSTRVLTPAGIAPAVVHIAAGRITRLSGYNDYPPDADLDDAGSLVVMPGVVDTHVHFNEPGRTEWEGFESGTAAAAAGGVTTVVDMPLNSVPATTDVGGFVRKRDAAEGRVHVDVAFWGGVVPGNTHRLRALAGRGVAGFKAFMVPSGVDEFPHVTEQDLREAMPVLAELGLPLLVHAEWPPVIDSAAGDFARCDPRRYDTWLTSRPPHAETEAIELLIRLCREYRTRIHIVHLAAAAALPALSGARAERLAISVETCPHYLTFAAEGIPDGATEFKCAPPIREKRNQAALWRALAEGTIDLIASDHSPCPPAMKQLESGDFVRAWGGIGSVELLLPAVWSGAVQHGLPLARVARLLCTAPADLAGLRSRKGSIAVGFDADLVVWDPDAEFTVDQRRLRQRNKITPYDGLRLRGVVHRTYLRGQLVYSRDKRAAAESPSGILLKPHHS